MKKATGAVAGSWVMVRYNQTLAREIYRDSKNPMTPNAPNPPQPSLLCQRSLCPGWRCSARVSQRRSGTTSWFWLPAPFCEVIFAVDDTIERRWGAKIKARGIYRDPVRSSRGQFVKTSGLRWLCLAVVLPIPFAARCWALPFLTVLAPSARWSEAQGKRHKTLTDFARQAILQSKRWLADRRVVVVADSSFAALELIAAVRRHVCLITRLRLDASHSNPPPHAHPANVAGRGCKADACPSSTLCWRIPTLPGHR